MARTSALGASSELRHSPSSWPLPEASAPPCPLLRGLGLGQSNPIHLWAFPPTITLLELWGYSRCVSSLGLAVLPLVGRGALGKCLMDLGWGLRMTNWTSVMGPGKPSLLSGLG
jgi:hypothetical protein